MAVRKETIKKQFEQVIPSALEPGERYLVGSYCVSGPNPLWSQGLLGLVGMLIFGVRYYFLAVTDRRVLLWKASFWTSRPAGPGFADPRSAVRIFDVDTDAKLWNHLMYERPGHKPLRLNIHAWWRDEMKAIVAELGGSAAPPAPPAPSPAPPPPPPA
jgi:hypothetical protein